MIKSRLKHARSKGAIISALKTEYPEGVDFVLLRRVLHNIGYSLMAKELSGYLHYLEELKYITIVKCKDVGMSDTGEHILYAKITAKGLDLHDGIIKDEAVLIR